MQRIIRLFSICRKSWHWKKRLKQVVRLFRNKTNELVHIKVKGEEITTTDEHPFYVPEKGWTAAIAAKAGVSGVTSAAMSAYNGGDLVDVGKAFGFGVGLSLAGQATGKLLSPLGGKVTKYLGIGGASTNPATSQLIKIGGVRLTAGLSGSILKNHASPFIEGLLSNL